MAGWDLITILGSYCFRSPKSNTSVYTMPAKVVTNASGYSHFIVESMNEGSRLRLFVVNTESILF